MLKDKAIDFSKIVAVLITHDHADHIKTVGCLGEKMNIPVYTTAAVHRGIEKSRYVEETLIGSRRVIEKEVPFTIRNFNIIAFEVPHDGTDNCQATISNTGSISSLLRPTWAILRIQ